MKKRSISLVLVLFFVFSVSMGSATAVTLRASETLTRYSAILKAGRASGSIKVSYDILANDKADSLGISSIVIYKSDNSYVTTITGSESNGLIKKSSAYHQSSYTYAGKSGTSYYAVVTVFATIGDKTDSRSVTTKTVKAP